MTTKSIHKDNHHWQCSQIVQSTALPCVCILSLARQISAYARFSCHQQGSWFFDFFEKAELFGLESGVENDAIFKVFIYLLEILKAHLLRIHLIREFSLLALV